MFNWYLAIHLWEEDHKKGITLAQARYLADVLPTTTHPQQFDEAYKVITQLIEEAPLDYVTPKRKFK